MRSDLSVGEGFQKAPRFRCCQVKVELLCAVVCRLNQRPEHLLLQCYDGMVHCNLHLLMCKATPRHKLDMLLPACQSMGMLGAYPGMHDLMGTPG